MQDAGDGGGVCQESRCLPQTPLVIDGIELARVEESVPIHHVDLSLVHLRSGIFKFREETTRDQIVVILVDLTKSVADLRMSLVVVDKVLFAARDGYTTVGTFVSDVCGRLCSSLSCFEVIRRGGLSRPLVLWMRTVCILLYEGGATADDGRRRV